MDSESLENLWKILTEYNFVIDTSSNMDLICVICKRILIKPCNVPCGCRYCYDCLRGYLNGKEKYCLGEKNYCKIKLINFDGNVNIDQPIIIRIARIAVNCPMESCEFRSELCKISDHLRMCDKQSLNCPYVNIGCSQNKLVYMKLKEHFVQENYSHAKFLIEWMDNSRNEIKLLKRGFMELKQENQFLKDQMSIVEKDLHSKQVTILELQATEKHNLAEIELLNQEMVALKNENRMMKREIEYENFDAEMNQAVLLELQTKTWQQKQEIEIGKLKICQMERGIYEKLEKIEKTQDKLDMRVSQMWEKHESTTTESMLNDKTIEILETKIIDIQKLQAYQNFDEYVWCIENWDEKMKQAQAGVASEIYSDPFYSHRNGYKMRLAVYPDGDDKGKGTHLSLFIRLMKGTFDNILPWPFRYAIKLDLMSQETGLPFESGTLKYLNNPNSDAWKKPISEENDGMGYYQFIKLTKLKPNGSLCRGDKIWIRATPQMAL